jgi:flagellar hook-associated protein 2
MTANSGSTKNEAFTALLQTKLNSAFGTDKIAVSDESSDPSKLQLKFTVAAGSNLNIASTFNTALGLSKTESTSLNTGKTLGELLGADLGGLAGGVLLKAVGTVTRQTDGTYLDSQGNSVNASGERLGKDGELLYGFDLKLNDKVVGTYTRDTALESVLLGINTNTEAGVSVSYSKTTNQFVFNAKETGSGYDFSFDDGLAKSIFGAFDPNKYIKGKDAYVNMTVNGSDLMVQRSSNTFDVDGLSVTVKNTFNGSMDDSSGTSTPVFDSLSDPVTFTTTSDADPIVGAIKSMVEDFNTIMTELRSGFYTLPAQKSDKSRYEPLTEEDREGMTETAIKNYEEKAKQGILFGDSDLSSLYSKLLSAISPSGSDGTALRDMGISTDYYQGLTTISLDETKLRETLSKNPDSVRDAFTKVAGNGSTTNGLMQNFKTQLDTYAAVEGTKGILINKAGSKYASATLLKNSITDQIDTYETQRDKLQDQLSTKVDYYTRQFTRLEQLISEMNSQSSAIMGLMGQ